VLVERGWIRGWIQEQEAAEIACGIATVVLLALGAFFRSRRYWTDPIGLWGDEAIWARRLFKPSLTNFEFRPIGYMLVTRAVVHVYSDERTIRILSYAGGIASLFVTVDCAKYVFRSRIVRLLCLAAVVFHPLLIDMAREFKPYSEEFCVHLLLIWLFLRWRARPTEARLYALLTCSVLAFPFAYNIVFLLPATFALLGISMLSNREYRSLVLTVLAALAALVVMGGIYLIALRSTVADPGESFWGQKYDVFYLPASAAQGDALLGRLAWLGHKYVDLASFPGVQRDKWAFPEWISATTARWLTTADWYTWVALHAVGLAALFFPRRRAALVLLVAPLALCMIVNTLGFWPFGIFRSNAFLLAYDILIPMVGLDALIGRGGKVGQISAALGCLLILVPNLTVGFDTHLRKRFFTTHSELPTVLRRLKQLREQGPELARRDKTPVLIDWPCAPFEFSVGYNSSTNRELGAYLSKNFDFVCTKSPGAAGANMAKLSGKPFFVVVSGYGAKEPTRRLVELLANVLHEENVRQTQDLYFATGK
jgi:hypothetical protein